MRHDPATLRNPPAIHQFTNSPTHQFTNSRIICPRPRCGATMESGGVVARTRITRLAVFVAAVACTMTTIALQRTSPDRDAERQRMVDRQIKARGIPSPRVPDAMLKVPRHLFIPERSRGHAYQDGPLPIGYDQTISQPYIVALMTEALELEPGHRVLEIGTGSGYQAAILSVLVRDVYTIEIVAPLADRARETLARLAHRNGPG